MCQYNTITTASRGVQSISNSTSSYIHATMHASSIRVPRTSCRRTRYRNAEADMYVLSLLYTVVFIYLHQIKGNRGTYKMRHERTNPAATTGGPRKR
jgi:hypothetical protein